MKKLALLCFTLLFAVSCNTKGGGDDVHKTKTPKKLDVDKITVHGAKVENGKVTIGENFNSVVKENVTVTFKGTDNPTKADIIMTPSSLSLAKKGDKGKFTLSVVANEKWQAWSSGEIEVTRDGQEQQKSNEAKIIAFAIATPTRQWDGNVDEAKHTVTVEVDDTLNLNEPQKPTITVSAGASVSPASGVKQNFSNSETQPVEYTVTAEDGTTKAVYKVTVKEKKSIEARIETFKVDIAGGEVAEGEIDHKQPNEEGTIVVIVPFGTDITKIKPKITVSDGATVEPKTGEQQDFSGAKSVRYTVTAKDGVTQKIYVAEVIKDLPETITTVKGQEVKWNETNKRLEVTIDKLESDVELKIDDVVIMYKNENNEVKSFDNQHKKFNGEVDHVKLRTSGSVVPITVTAMLDNDHLKRDIIFYIIVK